MTFLLSFPTLVLGIESTSKISSGSCHVANILERCSRISSLFTDSNPSRKTTKAKGLSSHFECGIPTTAA